MNYLAHADAIIIDLRENGGGDPKMIALVSTYLFSKPTHLNDLWERKSNTTQQYWTLPYVPGNRLEDKPAYVLTSKRTFSGAEEFSYNLKNLKRATIVGETTGGGAHPVRGQRIDDHFIIGVPFARAINPISKTNWEGTGVEPDVKVPAAEALATAQKLAIEKLGPTESPPSEFAAVCCCMRLAHAESQGKLNPSLFCHPKTRRTSRAPPESLKPGRGNRPSAGRLGASHVLAGF
jgi:C-terminal processing protease CtpA/Prc